MERNILDRAQDVWSAVTTIAKQGGKCLSPPMRDINCGYAMDP